MGKGMLLAGDVRDRWFKGGEWVGKRRRLGVEKRKGRAYPAGLQRSSHF